MRRVAVVQEYVPLYRQRFFELLQEFLQAHDINLEVLAGRPSGEQAKRNDSWTSSLIVPLRQREVSVFGRRVVLSNALKLSEEADLVIFEQARRNVALYRALFNPFSKKNIALWGHGVDFAFDKGWPEKRLLQVLTRRANWFFGYTEESIEGVVSVGYPMECTTCVVNSIDTAQLSDEVDRERLLVDVNRPRGLVFVGGLDASKRVAFLLESLTLVKCQFPDLRIDFIGDGPLREAVDSFAGSFKNVNAWGFIADERKAHILAHCDAIVMPGRVGLVALDSFACGLPIITTEHNLHAPEFYYLTKGENCCVSDNSVDEYAMCILDLLRSGSELERMQKNCRLASGQYSIERMVTNFGNGVLAALESAE